MENTVTISTKEYLELIKLKESDLAKEVRWLKQKFDVARKLSIADRMSVQVDYARLSGNLRLRIEALEAENERLKSMSIWDFLFKKNI